MTLQQLFLFQQIVQNDFNISKTAELLNMSQPGLSRQILTLEKELDTSLFVRNKNRLTSLTQFGHLVLQLSKDILNKIESIKRIGEENNFPDKGSLTIATTHTQAKYILPKFIHKFSVKYPFVKLRILQGTPSDSSKMVANGSADLSIATKPIEKISNVSFLKCYEIPRIIMMPLGHPLNKIKNIDLHHLVTYPLITYDFDFISRSKILDVFFKANLNPNIVLNAIDADVIKTYVELGMGIAILPAIAYDQKNDKKLRSRTASHLFEPNLIYLGLRSNDFVSRHSLNFIELFAPNIDINNIQKEIFQVESI
jgi:LysR family cys regulon transcriptional activator